MNTIHDKNLVDLSLFYKIDINLYPVFISIYEQKNISKAAQILNVSQSAASHALNRLRHLLQDQLFTRSGHQMLATPFAEQIYPQVVQALSALQQISIPQQTFDPHQIKQLRIAVHDEIEPMIFPQLVQHFHSLHLDIELISAKLDRKNMLAELCTQQIDFVIDLENMVSDQLQFDALIQDRFVVCTQQKDMNQQIYFSSSHIGVSSRRTGVLVEDIYLQRKQLNRDIFLRCQHYSTALQILQHYPEAILTVPKSVIQYLPLAKKLNIFEVPVELPILNLGMYWLKDLKLNKRHDFLRSEIYKIFA